MTHLNELDEKFAGKGLTVLGLTSEGTGPTEKWIDEKGAKYAYAYDKGGALARALGVRGIPDAVLVDPTGKIVWQGGPGSLKDSDIEAALSGALTKPIYEWPSELASVGRSLAKGSFKKALDEAGKTQAAQDEGIVAAIEGMIKGRVDALKAAHDSGDFLTAYEMVGSLKKQLSGLDACDEVDAVSKAISSNRDAKSIMKAQAKVRKLRDEPINRAEDAAELLEKAEKLAEKYGDNAAGREASAFAAELRERLQ